MSACRSQGQLLPARTSRRRCSSRLRRCWHVLLAIANPALAAMLLKVSATFWRFVKVTVFEELVVPTVTVPKFIELVESVTGALPFHERATVCGLFGASSVKVSVPVIEPVDAGENVTPAVQLAPAAILAPHVFVATANPALAAMLVKFSGVFSRFVKVTVLAELVSPTASVPKFKLVGERLTGALPLPVRFTVCVPALSVIVTTPEAEPTTTGANDT